MEEIKISKNLLSRISQFLIDVTIEHQENNPDVYYSHLPDPEKKELASRDVSYRRHERADYLVGKITEVFRQHDWDITTFDYNDWTIEHQKSLGRYVATGKPNSFWEGTSIWDDDLERLEGELDSLKKQYDELQTTD